MDVEKLIAQWQEAQTRHIEARESCRLEWAKAYLAADAKTDAAKKAAADVATSELRLARDRLETQAAAAWQLMLAERGRIESSQMPGRHWGESAA